VILCLFLVSVGVLELILRHDRKKQQDSTSERESALSTPFSVEMTGPAAAPPVTDDLLSLMRAVQGEGYGVESKPQRVAPAKPEPGDGSPARLKEAGSMIEYNRGDAGAK
jgi:hypothetical protein